MLLFVCECSWKGQNWGFFFLFLLALLSLCTAKHRRSQLGWMTILLSSAHLCVYIWFGLSPCRSLHKGFSAAKLHSSTSLNEMDRMRRCHLTFFYMGWHKKTLPFPISLPHILAPSCCEPCLIPSIQISKVDSACPINLVSGWCWSLRYLVVVSTAVGWAHRGDWSSKVWVGGRSQLLDKDSFCWGKANVFVKHFLYKERYSKMHQRKRWN